MCFIVIRSEKLEGVCRSSELENRLNFTRTQYDYLLGWFVSLHLHDIYMYAFSRRFYPKRLPRESFTKEHLRNVISL